MITNKQIEELLRTIPANWTISFYRPLLRPDIIEINIARPDGIRSNMKTTGAMLLERGSQDFLLVITAGVEYLKAATNPQKINNKKKN
jgi:predicted transcriptional regulator